MDGWAVVIPVKRLAVAKTRLADYAGARRGDLALAFAADTLAAAVACSEVAGIVVVTDDEVVAHLALSMGCLRVADEPDAGLNTALAHGAGAALRRWPGTRVAALSADLPALRPDELGTALQAARHFASAFVADTGGDGTTLLASATGSVFVPRFGTGSAAAHRLGGAAELTTLDVPSLRRDVDTPADLREAISLGVGPRTSSVLDALPNQPAQPSASR
jgi:2-phospho-L-lactate guanylyltransferase